MVSSVVGSTYAGLILDTFGWQGVFASLFMKPYVYHRHRIVCRFFSHGTVLFTGYTYSVHSHYICIPKCCHVNIKLPHYGKLQLMIIGTDILIMSVFHSESFGDCSQLYKAKPLIQMPCVYIRRHYRIKL